MLQKNIWNVAKYQDKVFVVAILIIIYLLQTHNTQHFTHKNIYSSVLVKACSGL